MLQACITEECFTANRAVPEEPTELQRRDQQERKEQHRTLQLKARAIFAALKGRPGIRSAEDLARIMAKVTVDYENGRFLLEQLGADRFIDYEKTLTLGHIREQLLVGVKQPTMADKLAADSAVIAYHNILRLQAWIGNIALVVERDLFGQAPLDEIHGLTAAERLTEDLRRLEYQIFPLLVRAHRMLMRSLNSLQAGGGVPTVTVGRASQVNVASIVAQPPKGGTKGTPLLGSRTWRPAAKETPGRSSGGRSREDGRGKSSVESLLVRQRLAMRRAACLL